MTTRRHLKDPKRDGSLCEDSNRPRVFATALSEDLEPAIRATIRRVLKLKAAGNPYTDSILGADLQFSIVVLRLTDADRLALIPIQQRQRATPHLNVALVLADDRTSNIAARKPELRILHAIRMARQAGYLPVFCPIDRETGNTAIERALLALVAFGMLKSMPCIDFLDACFDLSPSNSAYGVVTCHPNETMLGALNATIPEAPKLTGLLGTRWDADLNLERVEETSEWERVLSADVRVHLLWRARPLEWADEVELHTCLIQLFECREITPPFALSPGNSASTHAHHSARDGAEGLG